MPKKILITGPESTGKSTLAKALAAFYQAPIVTEFAREYIDQLDRAYQEKDLLEMAKNQVAREDEYLETSSGFIICDTDLTVIHIWSQEKYGRTHPWILEEMQKRAYDLYLIPDIDLKWTFDPQRENPYDRDRLMRLYQDSFKSREILYCMVRGQGEDRVNKAIDIVNRKLNFKK